MAEQDLLQTLARVWADASRNPTETSVADRLRPPYQTPLPWAVPVNAPASVLLEQGWPKLHPAYQNLMRQSPLQPDVPVGFRQPGYRTMGLFTQMREDVDRPAGLPQRLMLAESPGAMAHELVHALVARQPSWLMPPGVEEALAQMAVKGQFEDPTYGKVFNPSEAKRAREIHQGVLGAGQPTAFQRFLRAFGVR